MATCVLNGVTAGQNSRLQAVDFSFTHPTEDSLAVSWSPLPQNYAIQCYFIILLNFCYTKTADSRRTSKAGDNSSVYAFTLDPKVRRFSAYVGQLEECTYNVTVVAQHHTNAQYKHSIIQFQQFTIGAVNQEFLTEQRSMDEFFNGDSLIICLAFLFWGVLISTFFKEWGAIKNLQPREISRKPAAYPHNVTDVKVIQRERESVINCRSPDIYSSRIEKFSKMRQFRHSANRSPSISKHSLNNLPSAINMNNDQLADCKKSTTEIHIEDVSDDQITHA